MGDARKESDDRGSAPWETVSPDESIVWSLTREGGVVQGPLDLSFVAGRTLHLVLEEGQVALYLHEQNLEAVYLAGRHDLVVGDGEDGLDADGSLIFLDTARPWTLRWRRGTVLTLRGSDSGFDGLEIIGAATCRIVDPVHFYSSFVAGSSGGEERDLERVIDALLRARLEEHLSALGDASPADLALMQSRLTGLQGEDLDEDLEPYGLSCEQLSLYTACPPSEDGWPSAAGQFPATLHNNP
jgi:hypothetical protein